MQMLAGFLVSIELSLSLILGDFGDIVVPVEDSLDEYESISDVLVEFAVHEEVKV